MTLPQLDELLKLRPDLLNHAAFVRAWVAKLQPGADADWRRDRRRRPRLPRPAARRSSDRLAPAHNALKAHVLYHRLALDRADGVYDKARFLAYLQAAAAPAVHGHGAARTAGESHRFPADLNADFAAAHAAAAGPGRRAARPQLPASTSSPTADSPKEFEPYIDDDYLKHLFAETKIENGLGDPEPWASQLPPELFAPAARTGSTSTSRYTNKTDFAADEPVRLDLFVKNVPTLLVKVFEVNTRELLPHAAAGGGHRHQPRRPGAERRADAHATPSRRCGASPGGSSSRS